MENVKKILSRQQVYGIARFTRYGMVSALALGVDVSLLIICHQVFQVNVLLATTIGFICGVAVNYLLCIWWVFNKSRYTSRKLEFALTVGIASIGLLINNGIMWLMVSRLSIFYLIAKLVSAVVVFFWNFVIRTYYVHSPRIAERRVETSPLPAHPTET